MNDHATPRATGSSPIGPFPKNAHNPILHDTASVKGPGGGSVVQEPHGDWWLAYHAWHGKPDYMQAGVRGLRIDRLVWKGATVRVDGPTVTPQPAP